MPKTKRKKKDKEVLENKLEEVEVLPVLCGHEEVRTEIVEGKEIKIFRCGDHGEHPLSECQKLCTKK